MSTQENTVTITVELTQDQAREFAQFLKRVQFSTYMQHVPSMPEDEKKEVTYLMVDAGESIRRALADVGYNPR